MSYYRSRRALRGFGDWSDSSACSDIPAGDPYRKPGNYCTQPSGNVIEFNADGSIDADPFAPSGASSGTGGGSSIGAAINAITGAAGTGLALLTGGPKPPTVVARPGMSTTTKVALAGAAILGIALIARRR